MADQPEIRLNADFSRRVEMRAADAVWTPSPAPGVTRRMLDRIGGELARATSLVRYAPDSRFPTHVHEGGEEFLVLEGVFSDPTGDFGPGAYVRNPPGTSHAPWTGEGCVILVKLRQMNQSDRAVVRIDTSRHHWIEMGGLARMPLHEGVGERVELLRWPPGFAGVIGDAGGVEILVLEGGFEDAGGAYTPGDWLRLPPGEMSDVVSATGCRLWLKQGHLSA